MQKNLAKAAAAAAIVGFLGIGSMQLANAQEDPTTSTVDESTDSTVTDDATTTTEDSAVDDTTADDSTTEDSTVDDSTADDSTAPADDENCPKDGRAPTDATASTGS